ncbi:hypothetical protein IFM89_014364 [Coptis chinensis]|uniref:Argininosuccinate lyase n=1 Tax=Coptis chinensis TaxID=261450 RepID=A0A835IMY7_9MAGN|nr:hypothetical protein IFM89_014364 [Coptis chinensis]
MEEEAGRVKDLNREEVALVNLAKKNEGLIVPGYTHMQRAQPILLPHLILSYVEQVHVLWGNLGLPIDRFMTSDALGFTAPMRSSIDAVSDWDFVLEILSANSIAAVHLSRLGEEWVLWASEEFGFLTPNSYKCTTVIIESVRAESIRAVNAETEVQTLKDALAKLEAEKEVGLLQ